MSVSIFGEIIAVFGRVGARCGAGGAFWSPEPRSGGESMRIRAFFDADSQRIENFLEKFLEKSLADCKKAVLLRSCFAGAGRASEGGRGDGSRGEKTFRKIFPKKFGGSKKRCTFAPPNGKRGRPGRPGGRDGARRKPGREP